jgi:methionine-gamma-lyase
MIYVLTLILSEMKNQVHPESLMMSHGHHPEKCSGSVKSPLYLTSTFEFQTAQEGKDFFALACGLREKLPNEELGLIYSRMNNPNLEIFEKRLRLWDEADECAAFESGMAAITTVLLEFLRPGDVLLYTMPTYGGTDHFINHFLKDYGIECVGFNANHSKEDLVEMIHRTGKPDRLSFIFIETPANPTNDLFDIRICREIADMFSTNEKKVHLGVDNTFMGPIWSKPLSHGADLVLYSATKYIGGHSDLVAGAVLGKHHLMKRIKSLRTYLGSMASPHTCWLLSRSLETLKIRMEKQMENARLIAGFLEIHPMVQKVYYLGLIPEGTKEYELYKRQYSSPGAMVAFDINGGEEEAFRFMDGLKLFKLAVSLGSTESLVQHPAAMTHAGIPAEEKQKMGISEKLIRLSIGLEHPEDLIRDIEQSFDKIYMEKFQPDMSPSMLAHSN